MDKWLGDLNKRYGGIDKALIWPTYTNIGIDDRNTFDLIRSMPGGAAGVTTSPAVTRAEADAAKRDKRAPGGGVAGICLWNTGMLRNWNSSTPSRSPAPQARRIT